jgi:DNA mismatch repair protein MutL
VRDSLTTVERREPAAERPLIRILPPELAEQIAAGEVVERPASVAKELVENAIDAGARKIEVTLEAGGRRLVRVSDDGCGMTADEARLSLKRHATSKLVVADDLWNLGTFGFRGEALPSIASVSRMSLATKARGTLAGFRLDLEGGRELDGREAGLPDGTQIEVRDLFFNTPARLKFLKTEATEAANVSEALLRLALANPDVHIKLRSNDRTVLDLPPVTVFAERVRSALGRRGAGALHQALGEENGVKVQAFVGPPEEASSTARNTFLFVGRRAVRDRSLLAALTMAYGELLEKGRYPLAALFLEVPGAELDVNVHPQKLEVRFARAQEVYAAVRHVVGAALARAPWLAQSPPGSGRGYGVPVSGAGTAAVPPPPWSMAEAAAGAARGSGGNGGARSAGSAASDRFPSALPFLPLGRAADALAQVPGAGPAGLDQFFTGLRYVGQVHRTYLVCEAPGELVLVDQHAAHERVVFSRLQRAHRARAVARQQLLFPLEIELDEQAAATAARPEAAQVLAGLGFEWDGFGERRLVLRAVPELLKDADPRGLLLDALGGLGDDPAALAADEAVDHLLATMACHSVKRAGDVMTGAEAEALLASLDAADLRGHCPHGRPVLVRLTLTELERRFGRA